ncbi:SLC13 family permease [Fusobacterium polymorphum]|uniref:Sodium:sulfate symporter n=1 Tax=Fusobacterium nucleatum subsp. polymorphum TaxID=76857 RepID=A0A2C6B6V6_FUSNP|nr:anion permease [Fusobacterium polymorphum]PHH99584.1 sodium:sulfate symporter [Fusobacterium polymorphum]PIM75587.1 sodium:sulfate symporter [Fusobacterium polymorphum]
MQKILEYIIPEKINKIWGIKMFLSMLFPIIILIWKPFDLTFQQAIIVASTILVIIWWSAGIVKKIPASFFLLLMYYIFSGASVKTIISFSLSETFLMIIVTYLFSQGIANSGLIDKIFQPLLIKLVHTPCQCLIAVVGIFYLTMYVIPQPLARLIIVSSVLYHFLQHINIPKKTKNIIMYGVFVASAVVNISTKDADIILNNVAASFSEIPITNRLWIYYMFIPTLITCCLLGILFIYIFRKELIGIHLGKNKKRNKIKPFSIQQKLAIVVIIATILLWATNSIHGINNTLITIVSTVVLFAIKILNGEDWKAVDITTLIFLTAAFSIGTVMKFCGAADKVFGQLETIFPTKFSLLYVCVMILITMLLHMILGSNTTTLSVVIPGLMILCSQVIGSPIIVFISVISVAFHAILPFHSISLMIGASNNYYPAKYVTKLGLPVTLFVYLIVIGVYIPYWSIVGLL